MNFIKKYFKILIGAGVLIVALFVFMASLRSKDLSGGTLKNWASANNEERVATVRTLPFWSTVAISSLLERQVNSSVSTG